MERGHIKLISQNACIRSLTQTLPLAALAAAAAASAVPLNKRPIPGLVSNLMPLYASCDPGGGCRSYVTY